MASFNGLKLMADNGLKLMADNGLKLMADNGLKLMADNGLKLMADNGLKLMTDLPTRKAFLARASQITEILSATVSQIVFLNTKIHPQFPFNNF